MHSDKSIIFLNKNETTSMVCFCSHNSLPLFVVPCLCSGLTLFHYLLILIPSIHVVLPAQWFVLIKREKLLIFIEITIQRVNLIDIPIPGMVCLVNHAVINDQPK